MSSDGSYRALALAVLVLLIGSATAGAQNATKDSGGGTELRRAIESVSQRVGQAIVEILQSATESERGHARSADTPGKPPAEREGSWLQKSFRGVQPGACRMPSPGAPSLSWPARGESAVTLCKP
jgi:hypothetical protein